jgi:hypothetical protein
MSTPEITPLNKHHDHQLKKTSQIDWDAIKCYAILGGIFLIVAGLFSLLD